LRAEEAYYSNSIQAKIADGNRIVSPETHPFLIAIANYTSDDPAKFIHSHCTGSVLSK
jgi:hypothetical protein